jgi:hypothetical protein
MTRVPNLRRSKPRAPLRLANANEWYEHQDQKGPRGEPAQGTKNIEISHFSPTS